MKYNLIKTKNKIIAFSSYGGRTVKGIAKCNPEDAFDELKGEALAVARCAFKIADKRRKNAIKKFDEASKEYDKAFERRVKMNDYVLDANSQFILVKEKLDKILKEI